MGKLDRQVRSFLILDAFFIFFCMIGIYHLSQKADLPFPITHENDIFLARGSITPVTDILPGDTLISFDGMHFTEREGLEIYLDSRAIGDDISISYFNKGIIRSAEVRLVEYYSLPFILSNTLAGFLFIAFGIFVLVKCPDLKAAKIFHWGSIGIAVMLLTTWGKYTMDSLGLSIAARTVFHFFYVFTPAAFLHFSLVFPKDREKRFRFVIRGIYTAAFVIAVINIYFFIGLITREAKPDIDNYLSVFLLNRILAFI